MSDINFLNTSYERLRTKLKEKLIVLYGLNITDLIFSLVLFSTNKFKEANTYFNVILQTSNLNAALYKILIPGIILYTVFLLTRKIQDPQLLNRLNVIVNLGVIVYIGLNVLHVYYCTLYVYVSLAF